MVELATLSERIRALNDRGFSLYVTQSIGRGYREFNAMFLWCKTAQPVGHPGAWCDEDLGTAIALAAEAAEKSRLDSRSVQGR